jgi:hypothetical protein
MNLQKVKPQAILKVAKQETPKNSIPVFRHPQQKESEKSKTPSDHRLAQTIAETIYIHHIKPSTSI